MTLHACRICMLVEQSCKNIKTTFPKQILTCSHEGHSLSVVGVLVELQGYEAFV